MQQSVVLNAVAVSDLDTVNTFEGSRETLPKNRVPPLYYASLDISDLILVCTPFFVGTLSCLS
jgi:hypothetical protein